LADVGEQPAAIPTAAPLYARIAAVTTQSRIPAANARKAT
jgi:hypothetical protein